MGYRVNIVKFSKKFENNIANCCPKCPFVKKLLAYSENVFENDIQILNESGCFSGSPFGTYEALIHKLGLKPTDVSVGYNRYYGYKMSYLEFKRFICILLTENDCPIWWIYKFLQCLKKMNENEYIVLELSY